MSIDQSRAKINAAIWQAVAQSGVDLGTITHSDQEKLVSKISENLLMALDSVIENENPIALAVEDELQDEETVLWQGRPFLSMVEFYTITTERLKIVKGFVGRDVEVFELIRLQDIDYKQHAGERIFNIGDISIRGHDASAEMVKLRNIKEPEEVYEILRKAWMAARKRHGLQFREFM